MQENCPSLKIFCFQMNRTEDSCGLGQNVKDHVMNS